MAIAGNCPQLKSVILEGCWPITDVSVGALAENCPLLESVDLQYCELDTDVYLY